MLIDTSERIYAGRIVFFDDKNKTNCKTADYLRVLKSGYSRQPDEIAYTPTTQTQDRPANCRLECTYSRLGSSRQQRQLTSQMDTHLHNFEQRCLTDHSHSIFDLGCRPQTIKYLRHQTRHQIRIRPHHLHHHSGSNETDDMFEKAIHTLQYDLFLRGIVGPPQMQFQCWFFRFLGF